MARKAKTECPADFVEFLSLINEAPRTDVEFQEFMRDYESASNYAFPHLEEWAPLAFDNSHQLTAKEWRKQEARQNSGDKIYREFYNKFPKFPHFIRKIGLTKPFVAEFDVAEWKLERQVLINAISELQKSTGYPPVLPRLGRSRDLCIRYEGALERLLLCPICEEIVWTKRKGSKTCGRDRCVMARKDIERGKTNLEKVREKIRSKRNDL